MKVLPTSLPVAKAVGQLTCWVPCLLLVGLASFARAHAPPVGLRLAFAPDASAPPLVLANRGLVQPTAQGGWQLRCNEAYDVTPAVRPALLRRSDGSELLIANLDGVLHSGDAGCSFLDASPVDGRRLTASLAAGAGTGRLYVATGNQQHGNALYRTDDIGTGWQMLFDNAEGEWFTSLVEAPGDPTRLYAGVTLADYEAESLGYAIGRSSDAGQSWTLTPTAEKRRVLAVHPGDPDIVFAQTQLTSTGEWALFRSVDGGATFAQVLLAPAELTSLALAPDGISLWLGGELGTGLMRSDDEGASFQPVTDTDLVAVQCLQRHAGRLWACAIRLPNQAGIWSQPEGGGPWEPLLTFDEVTERADCGGEDAVCEAPWHDWAYELLGVPYPDAGVPGGSPDAGDGGPANDAAVPDAAPAEPGTAGDGDADPPAPGASGGCGIARDRTLGPGSLVCFGLLLAMLGARRRQGWRRSRIA